MEKDTFPVSSELIQTVQDSEHKRPERLTSRILKRIKRLAWAGEDVDIVIKIRRGKVQVVGHSLWFNASQEV